MYRVDCPDCGPTLLWESRIIEIRNADDHILVRYVCVCGTPGEVVTGRRARRDADGRRDEPVARTLEAAGTGA
jgi:hypothetical protein